MDTMLHFHVPDSLCNHSSTKVREESRPVQQMLGELDAQQAKMLCLAACRCECQSRTASHLIGPQVEYCGWNASHCHRAEAPVQAADPFLAGRTHEQSLLSCERNATAQHAGLQHVTHANVTRSAWLVELNTRCVLAPWILACAAQIGVMSVCADTIAKEIASVTHLGGVERVTEHSGGESSSR